MQPASAESKIHDLLCPLPFLLHLNITAQILGKSWELLGISGQAWGGWRSCEGCRLWGQWLEGICHLAGSLFDFPL